MTLDEIKRLIEFLREQDITEFELDYDGVKLRLKSGQVTQATVPVMSVIPAPALGAVAAIGGAAAAAGAPAAAAATPPGPPDQRSGAGPAVVDVAEEGAELAILKSPIVGTFYRASEPGAKPFVQVGDTVKKGQVLCIIEAMKLMNEIDSEYDGEIVNIYVENGQAVQYGERLFGIRPAR
jgi:acetyl-CoA carboxylase biotin carboxyl carrier protein